MSSSYFLKANVPHSEPIIHTEQQQQQRSPPSMNSFHLKTKHFSKPKWMCVRCMPNTRYTHRNTRSKPKTNFKKIFYTNHLVICFAPLRHPNQIILQIKKIVKRDISSLLAHSHTIAIRLLLKLKLHSTQQMNVELNFAFARIKLNVPFA